MRHAIGNATVVADRTEVTALVCCEATRRAIRWAALRFREASRDTLDDLVQVGTIGVLERLATEGYDPDLFKGFSRYAYWRAREAIGHYVAAQNAMKRKGDLTMWHEVHAHPRGRSPYQQVETRDTMQQLVNATAGITAAGREANEAKLVGEMQATYHLVVDAGEAEKVTDALEQDNDLRRARRMSTSWRRFRHDDATYVTWTNH